MSALAIRGFFIILSVPLNDLFPTTIQHKLILDTNPLYDTPPNGLTQRITLGMLFGEIIAALRAEITSLDRVFGYGSTLSVTKVNKEVSTPEKTGSFEFHLL